MSCTHNVCKECLPYIFLSGKCPICRAPVNSVVGKGKRRQLETSLNQLRWPQSDQPCWPQSDTSRLERTISEMKNTVQLLEKELHNYNASYKDYQEKHKRLIFLSKRGYDPRLFSVTPPLPPRVQSFSTQRTVQILESFNYKEKTLFLSDFERQELIENFSNFICEGDTELTDVTTLKRLTLPQEVKNGIFDKFENRIFIVAKGFLTLYESDGEKISVAKTYPDEFNFENNCLQICAVSRVDLMFAFTGHFLIFSFETGTFTTRGPLANNDYFDAARIYPDGRIALLYQPNGNIWPYRQVDRRFEIFY